MTIIPWLEEEREAAQRILTIEEAEKRLRNVVHAGSGGKRQRRLLALIAIAEAAQGLDRPEVDGHLVENADTANDEYLDAADDTLTAVKKAKSVP